ncbi:MAG: hypothetical protein ACTSRK_10720 [Promethearchaeota archaeon]
MINDELKEYLTERIGMDIHMVFPFESSMMDYVRENNGHLNGELKEVIGNTGWIIYSDMKRVNVDKLALFWFTSQ